MIDINKKGNKIGENVYTIQARKQYTCKKLIMGICYLRKYSLNFKVRITEFVSCFNGSLVVKVIKYRFVAPEEECHP